MLIDAGQERLKAQRAQWEIFAESTSALLGTERIRHDND